MGTIEQSCTFYQHPFCGPFLMFDTHAPVQTQSLFDHRVDAALETAGGFSLDPPMSWGVGDAVLIEVR